MPKNIMYFEVLQFWLPLFLEPQKKFVYNLDYHLQFVNGLYFASYKKLITLTEDYFSVPAEDLQ